MPSLMHSYSGFTHRLCSQALRGRGRGTSAVLARSAASSRGSRDELPTPSASPPPSDADVATMTASMKQLLGVRTAQPQRLHIDP